MHNDHSWWVYLENVYWRKPVHGSVNKFSALPFHSVRNYFTKSKIWHQYRITSSFLNDLTAWNQCLSLSFPHTLFGSLLNGLIYVLKTENRKKNTSIFHCYNKNRQWKRDTNMLDAHYITWLTNTYTISQRLRLGNLKVVPQISFVKYNLLLLEIKRLLWLSW
jgi:hypothetical protein